MGATDEGRRRAMTDCDTELGTEVALNRKVFHLICAKLSYRPTLLISIHEGGQDLALGPRSVRSYKEL